MLILLNFSKKDNIWRKKVNKHSGGAQTNYNGLKFEQSTSLNDTLIKASFKISDDFKVYDANNNFIGLSINQIKFSTKFLKDNGIDYKHYNSKR